MKISAVCAQFLADSEQLFDRTNLDCIVSAVLTANKTFSLANECAASVHSKVHTFAAVRVVVVAGLKTRAILWLNRERSERK
ncbi:MAG TPA: hypothetical protein VFF11_09215 [Candidatus Binatia bacterium]|nr:hypothetical protein [Candidatus Binatia bacterium]